MTEDEREFREFQEWKRRKGKTKTIELTGKGWKLATIIGGFLMVAGAFGTWAGFNDVNIEGFLYPWAPIIMAVGALTTIIASIGAYWYHG